jgi:hypothetical protein
MKILDEHFDSARRHFGVALIDLNYAAADLARSVVHPDQALGANVAFDMLNREIERLKALSALIERVADFTPGGDADMAVLQRWWPELVRAKEAHSGPEAPRAQTS